MQKILKDEEALRLLDERLSVLGTRRHSLDDELELEQLISDAVTEQTRLRCSIETHKSLLAYPPVRALPGEVLSEIFLYYIALSQRAHGSIVSILLSFSFVVACAPRLWLILDSGLPSL